MYRVGFRKHLVKYMENEISKIRKMKMKRMKVFLFSLIPLPLLRIDDGYCFCRRQIFEIGLWNQSLLRGHNCRL
jgi:hypothetical protein